MNNEELDKLLKSAPALQRSEDYWESFPIAVTSRLQRDTPHPFPRHDQVRLRRVFAYGLGFAAVCVFIGFALGFWRGTSVTLDQRQFTDAGRLYRQVAAMFPGQIQSIAFDPGGPKLALSDKPDVPASVPYYVKICGPNGCLSFVTFSGQQVAVNGDRCEVLVSAGGQVIVVGNHAVWSEGDHSGPVRITAKPLDMIL